MTSNLYMESMCQSFIRAIKQACVTELGTTNRSCPGGVRAATAQWQASGDSRPEPGSSSPGFGQFSPGFEKPLRFRDGLGWHYRRRQEAKRSHSAAEDIGAFLILGTWSPYEMASHAQTQIRTGLVLRRVRSHSSLHPNAPHPAGKPLG